MYCGQTAGWINIPLATDVGFGPGHTVLDKDPAPHLPPKRGTASPQFSAHDCCGQTAGWIKMPLGREVDLGPRHIVLDEDPAPLKRGTAAHFLAHVYCGQTAEWIKMPLGTKVGLGPGHTVLDINPAPPKEGQPPFRPVSIVAKRSPISATAEHLV